MALPFFVTVALSGPAFAGQAPLKIHLPREVSVESEQMSVADVSAVHGQQRDVAARVSAVALGRSPLAGETISIDRATVLSRLAACGVPAGSVQLSGAEKVVVRRKESRFSPDQVAAAAEAVLAAGRRAADGLSWKLSRPAEAMVLPAPGGKVELKARELPNGGAGVLDVEVSAVSDGKVLSSQRLRFAALYPHRQAVASKDISPGQKITPANTELATVLAETPQSDGFVLPFGMVATAPVNASSVIRPATLRAGDDLIAVRRQQAVVMKINGPGFSIRGLGEALDDGRCGDVVRVRNLDSKRIVKATVLADGSVCPIAER